MCVSFFRLNFMWYFVIEVQWRGLLFYYLKKKRVKSALNGMHLTKIWNKKFIKRLYMVTFFFSFFFIFPCFYNLNKRIIQTLLNNTTYLNFVLHFERCSWTKCDLWTYMFSINLLNSKLGFRNHRLNLNTKKFIASESTYWVYMEISLFVKRFLL